VKQSNEFHYEIYVADVSLALYHELVNSVRWDYAEVMRLYSANGHKMSPADYKVI
jgi:hypothetical protein